LFLLAVIDYDYKSSDTSLCLIKAEVG